MSRSLQNNWELENRKFKISISKDRGVINSIVFKREDFSLLKERVGGLKIYDGLRKAYYSDIDSKISNIKSSNSGNVLTVRKIYENSDFRTVSKFTMLRDCFRWDVSMKKQKGDERSIEIEFFLPIINQGWWFWIPSDRAPFELSNLLPQRLQFNYTRTLWEGWWGRISIPAAAVYNREKDVGLTILQPFEQKKPALNFSFNSPVYLCYNTFSVENLEVHNSCLGLVDEEDINISLILVPHQGDWREGLGWIFNKYREYFIPKNEEIYDMEGVYGGPPLCEDIDRAERELPIWRKFNLKWHELHNYFPWYGLYCP